MYYVRMRGTKFFIISVFPAKENCSCCVFDLRGVRSANLLLASDVICVLWSILMSLNCCVCLFILLSAISTPLVMPLVTVNCSAPVFCLKSCGVKITAPLFHGLLFSSFFESLFVKSIALYLFVPPVFHPNRQLKVQFCCPIPPFSFGFTSLGLHPIVDRSLFKKKRE